MIVLTPVCPSVGYVSDACTRDHDLPSDRARPTAAVGHRQRHLEDPRRPVGVAGVLLGRDRAAVPEVPRPPRDRCWADRGRRVRERDRQRARALSAGERRLRVCRGVLDHLVVAGVGDEHVPGRVDRHPLRGGQAGVVDHALGVAAGAVGFVDQHPVVARVGDEHVPGPVDRHPARVRQAGRRPRSGCSRRSRWACRPPPGCCQSRR